MSKERVIDDHVFNVLYPLAKLFKLLLAHVALATYEPIIKLIEKLILHQICILAKKRQDIAYRSYLAADQIFAAKLVIFKA